MNSQLQTRIHETRFLSLVSSILFQQEIIHGNASHVSLKEKKRKGHHHASRLLKFP